MTSSPSGAILRGMYRLIEGLCMLPTRGILPHISVKSTFTQGLGIIWIEPLYWKS